MLVLLASSFGFRRVYSESACRVGVCHDNASGGSKVRRMLGTDTGRGTCEMMEPKVPPVDGLQNHVATEAKRLRLPRNEVVGEAVKSSAKRYERTV